MGLFVKRILRTTQTSLEQAAEGNVKIVGVSIFTFEAGWMGLRLSRQKKSLLSCLTGISQEKIKYIKSRTDDKINEDTEQEFFYLVKEEGKKHTFNGKEWTIKFLTRDILKQIHAGHINPDNDNIIYIFLSIEGIQSLGIASMLADEHDFPLMGQKANTVKQRINNIKNTWRVLPQYITLCHHFGNGVIGHAPSVPAELGLLGVNQANFMNEGIKQKGKEIIDELLADNDRRILVDIKHFSARARKEYYAYIQGEIKTKFPHIKLPIPILCSHTGFINDEKLSTLSQLIAHTDNKKNLKDAYLHNATINMCKEDLENIFESGGLIGVQIDLKRLTGKKYLDMVKSATGDLQAAVSCEIVWANLFTAAGLLNRKEIWDMLCIGSDYDGIVAYLPGFPDFAAYSVLKEKLRDALENRNFLAMHHIKVNGKMLDNNEITRLMFGLTAEEILDRLFSENAVRFWKDHFLDQTRPQEVLVP